MGMSKSVLVDTAVLAWELDVFVVADVNRFAIIPVKGLKIRAAPINSSSSLIQS